MATGPYLVTRGIVLRDTDTRDADKILTLLTAEQGKIAVIARGARRKGCKFAACAQPLAYSEWTLHKKGQWYYANEGSTIELFNGLRSELDAMALGFYLAELTEGVITEESPQQELLSLLLNGLYAISTLHKPLPLDSFTLGADAQKRLSAAAEAFVSAQLERGFKTLDFYKSVRCMVSK